MRWLCGLVLVIPLVAGADSLPTSSPPDAGKKLVIDRVAAVVNDAVILTSELELRVAPLHAEVLQIKDLRERDRRLAKLTLQMLDEMVNEELIVQAANDAKITVDDSELQQTLDYIKQQNKLDDQGLVDAMKQQGISKATLRTDVLRQRAVHQLVGAKVQITDEDLRARYAELQRRSTGVSAVNLSHILFALPEHPTEQQLAAARAKAVQGLDRIKAGESFATVATQISEDASTKANGDGGMLGWFEPGTVSAEWEPTVFGMDKGDVRGPVAGPTGLHLLFANDIKRTQLKPFAELKDQLREDLRRRAMTKATQTWIEELRKKAYIDIRLK